MIRLKIGLEIRHDEVMRVCATEEKTVVVVVASYHCVSRNPVHFKALNTLDQSRGRKTDGGTRRSQRSGEEEATLVTVDQPFRHRTNQNQHPESGCWISLVHI